MPYYSEDYKLSVVKNYLKSKNYVETCDIFGCKRTSLIRWVKLYRKSYKIRKVHVEYIKKIIKQSNNRFISLEELNKKLKKKFKDYYITSQWLDKY